ncbi:tetratricopeptide repeat protein [Sorangium sp. So ce590]|uniref:tetratricopeptide repeat protein n=1 Tax=unclassified Sorangium TaxID=2621164 RepID=UPI003F5DFE2A
MKRLPLTGQIDAASRETRVRRVSDKDREQAEEKSAGSDKDEATRSDGDEVGAAEAAPERPPRDAPVKEAGGEGDDDAAQRVADALGVNEPDEAPPAEAAGEAAVEAAPNRAARRRDEATVRRRKKKAAGDDLPKDKNARAKELLARRREQAAGRRPVQLLPGEMVEDALSRMTSGAGRWLKSNFHIVQWGALAAVVATGGLLFYLSRAEKRDAVSSSALVAAVAADRGRVVAEDTRSEEEKELDATRTFKTAEERSDTALAAYNKVIDEHGGTGAAILAKLGQAGVLLDKKDYAHALDAYSAVVSSPLAGADPDVKGRAIEGIAFAREGKGDLDGALASFKELEAIDMRGYKELALYHQARIHLAKGDSDKAKELLKSAHEKLQAPSAEGRSFQFLEAVVEEMLRKIDPAAVPPRAAFGGPKGQTMTPEEIEQLIRRARENAEKKAGDAPH